MNALVLAVGLAAIACVDAIGVSSAVVDGSRAYRGVLTSERHIAVDQTDGRIAAYDIGQACAKAGGSLVREAGPDGSVSYRCYVAAR